MTAIPCLFCVSATRQQDRVDRLVVQPAMSIQYGNWTTRRYANSRIANSLTGQVADWTTRGLADAAKRTKTKHAKSPVASARCPVRELAIRELSSNLRYDLQCDRQCCQIICRAVRLRIAYAARVKIGMIILRRIGIVSFWSRTRRRCVCIVLTWSLQMQMTNAVATTAIGYVRCGRVRARPGFTVNLFRSSVRSIIADRMRRT